MIKFRDLSCHRLFNNIGDEIKKFSCGTDEEHKNINKQLAKILNDDLYALQYRTILAIYKDKIVGFITFRLKEIKTMKVKNKTKMRTVEEDSYCVFAIECLGIDSAFQKKGIGSRLLCLTFEIAVTTYYLVGCSGIYVESLRDATDFYKKLGFEYLKAEDECNPCCPLYQMAISIHTLENQLNITPFNKYAHLEIPLEIPE